MVNYQNVINQRNKRLEKSLANYLNELQNYLKGWNSSLSDCNTGPLYILTLEGRTDKDPSEVKEKFLDYLEHIALSTIGIDDPFRKYSMRFSNSGNITNVTLMTGYTQKYKHDLEEILKASTTEEVKNGNMFLTGDASKYPTLKAMEINDIKKLISSAGVNPVETSSRDSNIFEIKFHISNGGTMSANGESKITIVQLEDKSTAVKILRLIYGAFK